MFKKHKPKSTSFANNGSNSSNNVQEMNDNNNKYQSVTSNHHNQHHQQHQQQQQQQHQQQSHPPSSPAPSSQLVFHCQLAHGSPTAFVSGFSNVIELYQKIAEQFDMPVTEVSTYLIIFNM